MLDSVQHAPPLPLSGSQLLSVAEYHRKIETGELTEDDRVELLEGRVVPKMPRNPPHDGTIHKILKVLLKLLQAPFDVRVQAALTTLDSEPEPDLAIVKLDPGLFMQRHPEPRDVAVVIEIAHSSLSRDRDLKARVYARAGVPFYWLVNLTAKKIEVYQNPDASSPNPRYLKRDDYAIADSIPLILDAREVTQIPVRDLLP